MFSSIRFFVASIILIAATGVRADNGKSFSAQMNEIKRSGAYVYAEASASSESEAKSACNELLKIEITKYLAASGSQNNGIVKNIAGYNCLYISQPRGDMIRVFGYIAKTGISAGEQKQEPAPREEKPEPVKVADPPQQQPKAAPQPAPAGTLKAVGLHLAKWQLDMLETIVREPSLVQAKRLLNRYKNQNRIKRLGDKTISNTRPEDSFYLFYDGSDTPAALLAPSLNDSHYNMLNGSTVNINDYSGNQYLWFQISK